jgi:hypothetical protein
MIDYVNQIIMNVFIIVLLLLMLNVYGVVSHKASHTLRQLLICCASPSEF